MWEIEAALSQAARHTLTRQPSPSLYNLILYFTDKKGAGLQILAEFGNSKALLSSWLALREGQVDKKHVLRIK